MSTNPFVILGFGPQVFSGRKDSEVRDVVKSTYRALMMIHHTDKGGKVEVARALNEAYEILESPDGFREAKRNLLKPRKDRVRDLEAESLMLQGDRNRLVEVIQRLVLEQCLTRPGWVPVRSLVGRKLMVSDFLEAELSKSWGLGSYGLNRIVQIEVRQDDLVEIELQKRLLRKGEVGNHTPWVFHPNPGCRGVSYCWEPKGGPTKVIIGQIVGSIAPECSLKDASLVSGVKKSAVALESAGFSKETLSKLREGFLWDDIKSLAPRWSAFVKQESTLVSCDREKEKFRLLGRLRGLA